MSYDSRYKFSVIKHAPHNKESWNALAAASGNLFQSTHYDLLRDAYRYEPVYFEMYEVEKLIAGIKLYEYVSTKSFLKSISKNLLQEAELIRDGNTSYQAVDELKSFAWNYVLKSGAAFFEVNGYYGDDNLLIDSPNSKNKNQFNVAYLNLQQDMETLFANIHDKHKSSIRKAEQSDLEFSIEDNLNQFFALINNTYREQDKEAPNEKFLTLLYHTLKMENLVNLFFAKKNDDYLSAAFITHFGRCAYYAFAGNVKNNLGAGAFLHWNIIKHYKSKRFEIYNLGQVAANIDEKNLKFFEGISKFKRRFGGHELPSFSAKTILSPSKHFLWTMLLKLTGRK